MFMFWELSKSAENNESLAFTIALAIVAAGSAFALIAVIICHCFEEWKERQIKKQEEEKNDRQS